MTKDKPPPSTVRVVKHEAISPTEVRVTMEMIVDVHRMTELATQLLQGSIRQATGDQGQ